MKGLMRGIAVEGLNLERFIRLAAEQEITFLRLRRKGRKMTALADEAMLDRLQDIAQKGGWRFVVGRRHGTGRGLEALFRRWLLFSALAAVALAVGIAMQLMWRIDIKDAGVYAADVKAYLEEQNIRPVMWKRSVDLAALRDGLEWRYPDIAWAECGWRGMTLQITLVEGVPLGDTFSHTGSGDVIAARDGVIASIVTVAGTPQVKAGDIVRKGQVLILGEERTANEEIVPVMARGTVMARVWDGASVRMSINETETSYTGNQQEVWTIACPWFDLWSMADSGYELQDVAVSQTPVGGLFLPFTLRKETRMEVSVYQSPRDMAQLQAEAGEAALLLLRRKIGIHDDLVDKWVDYCMIEGEVLEAVAVGERMIDIAQARRNGC